MNLLWLLIFPIAWPFIAKAIWPKVLTWQEVGINVGGVVVLVSIIWFCGRLSQMSDHEIYNGEVQSKQRVHDSYIEFYSCNCSTDSKGNSHCQTCTREHYTVDWFLNTTIGKIDIQNEDSLSSGVYRDPDPVLYVKAFKGEPCSLEHSYDNYVRAVPQSLFGTVSMMTQSKFTGLIPAYPQVYDIYHIQRVINVKSSVDAAVLDKFNYELSEMLNRLGAEKQVNAIAIVTGVMDPNYRYAVENNWLGGKKNDVVIFIGTSDGKKIEWVDVMTWALNKGNGLFRVELKDNIRGVGQVDPDALVPVIHDTIVKSFTRPHMKDFEYLKKEIVPPTWVVWICVFLSVFGSLGASFLFYRMETEDSRRYHYRYR